MVRHDLSAGCGVGLTRGAVFGRLAGAHAASFPRQPVAAFA